MSQLAVAPQIEDASGGSRPTHGSIRRTALVNRLRAARSHPIVTVVAPLGYGKTTLLEQWAARDDRQFIWVTLDPAISSPDGPAAWIDAAGEKLAEGPTVIVLDDAHLLPKRALAAVAPLVRLAGEGSMLVLAGRTQPSIPNLSIPGSRARGELLELGVDDLAFTWREARTVARSAGAGLTDAEITSMFEETEGWPAAVGLAAWSLGHEGLRAECLDALTPLRRALLRRTSILERVSRELCDAVLGFAPGMRELELVDDLGAFVVPLDHQKRWFRYHRLLRPALREELEREEPEIVPVLHRRAADWFEAAGDDERAMEHAYAAGDIPRFMRIFSTHGLKAHNRGRDAAVEEWIGRVDDVGSLESYPDAAALAARLYAHRGLDSEAARCLDAADRALADTPPEECETASRASLVHAATDSPSPASMLAAADAALEHLPADDPWHPYGLLLQGVAYMLLDDATRADGVFGQAARAAERLGSSETRTLALTERALLADSRAEHAKADGYLSRIHSTGDRLDGFASYALTLSASARGLLRQGRWAEARLALE